MHWKTRHAQSFASETSFVDGNPSSHGIGNFRFATATISSTTTRFFPLNIRNNKRFIVFLFPYHIFVTKV